MLTGQPRCAKPTVRHPQPHSRRPAPTLSKPTATANRSDTRQRLAEGKPMASALQVSVSSSDAHRPATLCQANGETSPATLPPASANAEQANGDGQ